MAKGFGDMAYILGDEKMIEEAKTWLKRFSKANAKMVISVHISRKTGNLICGKHDHALVFAVVLRIFE